MKNLLVHGVYLSVIAVLSFFLYDKTKTDDFVFMKSSEALAINSEHLARQIPGILKGIESSIDAEPKYRSRLDSALKLKSISIPLDSKIETLKNSKNVSAQEITLLKNDVIEISNQLISLISDEQDKSEIKKKILLIGLIKNYSFWEHMSKTSVQGYLNQLSIIENYIINDRVKLLYYFEDRVSCDKCMIKFDCFRVAIVPKKAVIFEGEKIEVEIYTAQFAKSSINNTSISANGKSLITNDGIAHFEETTTNVGEHKITASITVKNPMTGETETVRGELPYEVLPKCSRDCAKN